MPGRAELAATADVGQHIGAAALQPQLAHLGPVDRHLGDLEAAVAEHLGWGGAVELHVLGPHQEVGHARPVGGNGEVLLDHVLAGVEAGRQLLHLGDGPGGGIGQPQRGRVEEALRGDEHAVRGARGVADGQGAVLGQGQALAGPGSVLQREGLDHALDVFQQFDGHPVAGEVDLVHRLAGVGREHQFGLGCGRAGLQRRQVVGQHCAGLVALPVLLDVEHQLAGDQAVDVALGRQGDQLGRPRRAQVVLVAEERDAAVEQHRLHRAVGGAQHARAGPHVVGLAAEHFFTRRVQVGAVDDADDVGVAGLGDVLAAVAPVAGDDPAVGAQPVGVLLAHRQLQAALHELAGLGVELADLDRVAAAVGQVHQAVAFSRAQAGGALEEPALALGLGQGVEVDQGGPLRAVGAVAGQRRVPPQAVGVGGVLPQVVDPVAAQFGHGDAVLGGEELQRLLAEGLVVRVGLQPAGGAVVLLLHPGQGLGAVDVLQPLERIVARRLGEGRDGCGAGQQGRKGDDAFHGAPR